MLISQSLFIDNEYKVDCENKINYFGILMGETEIKDDSILTTDNFVIGKNSNKNKTKEISSGLKKIIKEY